jgi:ectoine hydroxylase-related dioxygenase (phytanoyl-CoA dioxygenase family)
MSTTLETKPDDGMIAFNQGHLDALHRDGYIVVEGFVKGDLLKRAQSELDKIFPRWQDVRDRPADFPNITARTRLDFPEHATTLMAADALNDVALHPRLLNFTEQLLGTSSILLGHETLTAKYAGGEDYDQPMHVDMMSHTMVVPPDDQIDQLSAIIYYSDVTIDLGPTRVLPFGETAGYWRDIVLTDRDPFWLKASWTREEAPELYARERAVTVSAGSVLLYTVRTLHRGSAAIAHEGSRYTQHLGYHRADMTWVGEKFLPLQGLRDELGHMLCRLDPRQRSVLGFPAPGNRYWTPATCAAVQRRYPEMDLGPYRRAIAS